MKVYRFKKFLSTSVRFLCVLLLSFLIFIFVTSTDLQKSTASHHFPMLIAQVESQEQSPELLPTPQTVALGNVTLGGKTLFTIDSPVGAATPEIRAKNVSEKLEKIAKNQSFSLVDLKIKNDKNLPKTEILAGDEVIFTIYEVDVKLPYQNQAEIAEYYLEQIKNGIINYRVIYSPRSILFGFLKLILATVVLLFLLNFIQRIFHRLMISPAFERLTNVLSFRIGDYQLITSEQVHLILKQVANLIRLTAFLALLSIYVNLALSFFPWTQSFSFSIFQNVFSTVGQIIQNVIAYLPKLVFLLVIAYITFYASRFSHFIFNEIDQGKLSIPGFYQGWAIPTSRLVNILLIALAAIVAFPYLPGAGSQAFQGISLFLGILFSLGSTSAISNIIAGVFLTYTRAFEIGDEIEVGTASGVVVEKGLLIVRLLSSKNHFINIPNSELMNSHIVNLRLGDKKINDNTPPPIVDIKVTMSYDVPWRKAYQILLAAAQENEQILKDPAPFILQKDLKDHNTSYEVNAYTNSTQDRDYIRTQLLESIKDKCHQESIELVTPQHVVERSILLNSNRYENS